MWPCSDLVLRSAPRSPVGERETGGRWQLWRLGRDANAAVVFGVTTAGHDFPAWCVDMDVAFVPI